MKKRKHNIQWSQVRPNEQEQTRLVSKNTRRDVRDVISGEGPPWEVRKWGWRSAGDAQQRSIYASCHFERYRLQATILKHKTAHT